MGTIVMVIFMYLAIIHIPIVFMVFGLQFVKACSMIFGDDVGSRW